MMLPDAETVEAVIVTLIWGIKCVSAQSEAAVAKLADAIEAENPDLATTLMEVTNAGMNISFARLAESAIDWSSNEANFNNFKSMIKKKLENENSLFEGFLRVL